MDVRQTPERCHEMVGQILGKGVGHCSFESVFHQLKKATIDKDTI
jgi:hypothetical protein